MDKRNKLSNINKYCDHVLKPELVKALSERTGVPRRKLDLILQEYSELLRSYLLNHRIFHITGVGKFIYVPYRKRVISNLSGRDLGIRKGNYIKFHFNPDFYNQYKEADQVKES